MHEYVVVGLLLVLICVAAYLAHKIRRIHLQGFEILTRAEFIQREAGSLFAQIQALGNLEKLLELPLGLPALRGWAGSPDFLLHVSRHALSKQPNVVVECSSGASTVVLARCMQINGMGHVYSLEHDKVYADKTTQMLADRGLSQWATVIHAPLVPHAGLPSPWYDRSVFLPEMQQVEMVVVDGPPNAIGPLARYPAVGALMDRLSGSFHLFLDDADRPEEKEAVARWKQEWPELVAESLQAEKGLTVVRRT